MLLLNQQTRLLTGSADSELRAWDIDFLQEVRTDQTCSKKKENRLKEETD